MHRREFLKVGGALGLTAAFGGLACTNRQAGGNSDDAPLPLSSIGLQLYTVRTLMERDVPRTLEQVAAAGYPLVETAGLYGLSPEAFRALLDRTNLRTPSGHYPAEQLEGTIDTVFATARTLGQQWIVFPWLAPSARPASLAAYEAFAERLNRIGQRCRAAGFGFAYHNHDFEFETFGGSAPAYDTLLARTDPALVSFELDAYWVYKAGHDPVRYFERFPGRFPLCHIKDGTASPARRIADVGAGVIDFRRLFAASKVAGLRYAFVEHDEPADPLASIRASHDYLARLLRPA